MVASSNPGSQHALLKQSKLTYLWTGKLVLSTSKHDSTMSDISSKPLTQSVRLEHTEKTAHVDHIDHADHVDSASLTTAGVSASSPNVSSSPICSWSDIAAQERSEFLGQHTNVRTHSSGSSHLCELQEGVSIGFLNPNCGCGNCGGQVSG